MKKEKKCFSIDEALKKQIKKMISVSKEKDLIKPHTEAFKIYPVKEEKHKGKLSYFA